MGAAVYAHVSPSSDESLDVVRTPLVADHVDQFIVPKVPADPWGKPGCEKRTLPNKDARPVDHVRFEVVRGTPGHALRQSIEAVRDLGGPQNLF